MASALLLPVLWSVAACAPWLAVGAAAAERTGPVAVRMRSGNIVGDAEGEEEGLWLRTQGATSQTVPERLGQERHRIVTAFLFLLE